MAATRRLRELIDSNIPRLRLPSGPFSVALSGGADSAALALLCVEGGDDADALHIDHGLDASPRLSAAASDIASKLGLQLSTVKVEVGRGPSPEEQARDARYQVFGTHARPVLTAHTKDDSAETMVINLVRGTGAAGLTGIPYHRPPNTFRPMLVVPRDETREMAVLAGLPFFDDPMNLDPRLARNHVRQRVMPLLRELNPQASDALARAAESLGRDAALLDEMTPMSDPTEVALGVVATLPRPLADRLISRLLRTNGVGPTAERLERVWQVVSGEAVSHDLAEGLRVVRRGAMIVVE